MPENGINFGGTDDYVSVASTPGDELNPEFDLTIECWVNLNDAASGGHRPHLITKRNSYGLAVESSGYARLFLFTDGWVSTPLVASTMININQWYHLAATFDGVTGRLYVNGIEEATLTVDDTLNQIDEAVRIGAIDISPGNDNLNGLLDEVRIWNVTRTQAQIQASMNQTIPGSSSGLVGYWRFDESSGTIADCETTYANDGTLTNMSTPAVWQTSTAPIGETSIFEVSTDITETSECAVDVDFLSGDGPGDNSSMAVMQVNELPNSVSGLYPDRGSQYWEIWSEDPDFDGNFTADVRFHYDDISGLPTESALEIFRRDDATGTWAAATGFTVVADDGGSSTGTDGIGYVELTITEGTPGDFSGQYIISWTNEPPVVSNIPNQSVAEGSAFATINLDDYVDDPDNLDSEITWTATGETDVTVTITDRVASITADDPEWNGTDVITFTAEDPEGETDSDDATFEVTRVNDPPVVGVILDQEIAEGASFVTINLDDFVADVDDADNTITWTATGQTDLSVDITGRVATITLPDANWNGSEIITFQAEDPDGGTDTDQATFTVTPVNDPPVVDDIPGEEVAEGTAFATINLDDFVADVDDADNTITWTATGQSNLSVAITGRVATITPNDENWNGSEIITFQAEDPDGGTDTDQATFTVTPVNDPPVVDDIPDEEVSEGTAFATINLDDYVADVDDADNTIAWTATGQSNLSVDITGRVATITPNVENWNGSEIITFQVEDPDGESDSDQATFTVTPVNDAPVVDDIPDQEVAEGTAFATINLDDYVADVDDADNTITWTVTGQSNLSVDITGRVATITANDENWNGNETITFQAEDPDGETDSDQATFTVTPVNDPPVADTIPNQVVNEGGTYSPIDLDNYVSDVDDADSMLIWLATDYNQVTVDITNRVATITLNDPEWGGADWVIFIVEDPDGLRDTVSVKFTAVRINDLPMVADISDQTIAEGQAFAPINLNDFVADADDPDSLITWTVQGDVNVTVNIVDSVANISADDPEWNGSDTLIFTATDTSGAAVTDTSIFTVTPVNDAPTLSKAIPDFEVDAGTPFLFVLDPGTFTDVDPVDSLVISASMSMGGSTPAWLSFDASSGTFSGTPADADKGIVEVIITATDDSSASVADTFNVEVKSYVGISNPLDGLEINLYPNPNNGRFVIESDRFELKDVVLEIFNEKGQLIWNREIRDEIGTLHESVDLNNVADGLYLLRVRNKSGMISKRFVISL